MKLTRSKQTLDDLHVQLRDLGHSYMQIAADSVAAQEVAEEEIADLEFVVLTHETISDAAYTAAGKIAFLLAEQIEDEMQVEFTFEEDE